MGLLKEIVLLPLAPVRGTVWVADQIADEADRRLYDEDNIKRELLQLELDEEKGLIGPEERERLEHELFDRLAVARMRAAEAYANAEEEEVVDRG